VIIRSSVVKDWPDLVVRGWVRTVRPEDAGDVLAGLIEAGEDAFVCGELAIA
jgi:hypothetical protein